MSLFVTIIVLYSLLLPGLEGLTHIRSHTECVEDFIESPGFDANNASAVYQPDFVSWVVRGLPGMRFVIEFTHFDIVETENCDEYSEHDYVIVNWGDGTVYLGFFQEVYYRCGDVLPDPVTSINENFTINFQGGDDSPGARGFRLRYYPVCNTCSGLDLNTCSLLETKDCLYTSDCTGNSPSFSHYENAYDCAGSQVNCARTCDICQETYPDCDTAIPSDEMPSSYVVHTYSCSVTIGVGMTTVIYYYPPWPGTFYKCMAPCCCSPRAGTGGSAPAINCNSTGVIHAPENMQDEFCPSV